MAGKGSLAEEIRTGLDGKMGPGNKAHLTLVSSGTPVDPLDELYFRKPVRRHVKEFSCIIAIVLLVIGGIKLYRQTGLSLGYGLVAGAVVLVVLGYTSPRTLKPIWRGWMWFAEKLGGVMNVVLLTLAWTLAMIPIALMLRLFRKRVMDLTFRTSVDSYWEKRSPESDNFELLKRQF